MYKLLSLAIAVYLVSFGYSQEKERYKDLLFEKIEVKRDLVYGDAVTQGGVI